MLACLKKAKMVLKSATICNLENDLCQDMINSIHGSLCYSRKLYCNGLIPMTPEKDISSNTCTEPRNSTDIDNSSQTPPVTVVEPIPSLETPVTSIFS